MYDTKQKVFELRELQAEEIQIAPWDLIDDWKITCVGVSNFPPRNGKLPTVIIITAAKPFS